VHRSRGSAPQTNLTPPMPMFIAKPHSQSCHKSHSFAVPR
jgi:hypothetical protein